MANFPTGGQACVCLLALLASFNDVENKAELDVNKESAGR